MRVLWLCNIVLPSFSDIFDIPKSNVGGWLTGMWKELNEKNDIELAICCPIKDKWRMKDGVLNKNKYYSFQFSKKAEYSLEQENRFIEIIDNFKPDIVHIWGSEYVHTLAMVNACEKCKLLDRAVINIQGLVSVCAKHYTQGLLYDILSSEETQNAVCDFLERGKFETEAIKKVHHVIGRTDWDRACALQINPNVNYHFCNEIIRDSFYDNAITWDYDKCEKYSLFISQASYPIKGLHYTLQALPIVVKSFPDTRLYIAGEDISKKDSVYAQYIKHLITENNLQNHITFLGSLSEEKMCERFKKANAFISASLVENESNSLSEAKMIGVPSVHSYAGGVTERIIHGIDGFLFQLDAPYMMAYYICEIFKNPQLTAVLSHNASKNTMLINDKKTNGNICFEIYKKICEV